MAKRKLDFQTERDPKIKGSYRRRLDDAFAALGLLDIAKFRPEAAFVFYYLTCEKVAKVITGIAAAKPKGGGENFKKIKIHTDTLYKATQELKLPVRKEEIIALFASNKSGSASHQRNKLFHDFGPTQVHHAKRDAPHLNKAMVQFSGLRQSIVNYLDSAP